MEFIEFYSVLLLQALLYKGFKTEILRFVSEVDPVTESREDLIIN